LRANPFLPGRVDTEPAHITLSPAEFAQRFDWKNDPAKARLMKLDP